MDSAAKAAETAWRTALNAGKSVDEAYLSGYEAAVTPRPPDEADVKTKFVGGESDDTAAPDEWSTRDSKQ